MGAFMQAVTTTHVRRWRSHRHSVGAGHLYQGTYKSFPVQGDDHFYTVCRYVERNALRANLVARADDWRWGSLWQREQHGALNGYPPLCDWPLPRPRLWVAAVNPGRNGRRIGGLANVGGSRTTLRRASVANAHGQASRSGIHLPAARSPEKDRRSIQ